MEAGGKDCEDETLQTAFKKLRVDAESVPGAVSVCEAPRASRPSLDPSGAKPKLSCPKDNWHGCMRKSSRGASRTQRRRRSKSPILHPPKFTYCSAAAAAVSPPSGCLKQQRLAVPDPSEPRPPGEGITACSAAQKELSSSGSPNPISPLVFGSCAGFEAQETSGESSEEEKSASEGARVSGSADFRVLSERLAEVPCSCVWKESGNAAAESPCRCRDPSQTWQGVEVYSFTGLRNATSECGRTIVSGGGGAASSSSSGSARSCSEQARVYVDDITIEDLSGYMEYYLYIPKKMSHMAEMMYT